MNAMPRARGRIRLNIGPPSTRASTTTRSLHVRRPAILGVAQRALEHLLQHPRTALRLIPQDVQRLVGVLAADQVGQRPHLAGADPGDIDELLCRPWLYPSAAQLAADVVCEPLTARR